MPLSVVFDVGDVLVHWDPAAYVRQCFPDLDAERVATQIFRSRFWHALDEGSLERTAAERAAVSVTGLDPTRVTALFTGMPAALTPIPAMVELLARLSAGPTRLYVLSNMPSYVRDALLDAHDFWRYFDGTQFSCDVRSLKPEPKIYQALFDRFELAPDDCVFIDDKPENLARARYFDMQTIHMRSPDAAGASAVIAALEQRLAAV